jgi:hypothetical protein
MTPETTLLNYALRLLSEGRWGGFCALIAIWLLYRQRRYASALSARQQQRELRLVIETWKTALQTVLHEQPRRLQDLVEDTESEFEHKP